MTPFAVGGRGFGFGFAFAAGSGGGGIRAVPGVLEVGVVAGGARACDPLGTIFSLGGAGVETSGLRIDGPPVLIGRAITLGGSLIGGGCSSTGVGGRCIVTLGGVSSTPRRTRSASLTMPHRTS